MVKEGQEMIVKIFVVGYVEEMGQPCSLELSSKESKVQGEGEVAQKEPGLVLSRKGLPYERERGGRAHRWGSRWEEWRVGG